MSAKPVALIIEDDPANSCRSRPARLPELHDSTAAQQNDTNSHVVNMAGDELEQGGLPQMLCREHVGCPGVCQLAESAGAPRKH